MADLKIYHVQPDDRWEIKAAAGDEPLISFDEREQAERFLKVVNERRKRTGSARDESSDENDW
jgi:hypothetical protein